MVLALNGIYSKLKGYVGLDYGKVLSKEWWRKKVDAFYDP